LIFFVAAPVGYVIAIVVLGSIGARWPIGVRMTRSSANGDWA